MLRHTPSRLLLLIAIALSCGVAHSQTAGYSELEALARRSPTAEAWVKASKACSGDLCRFQALQQALRLEPDDPEAHIELGRYYFARSQYERAQEHASAVLKTSPANVSAHLLIAKIDLRRGDSSEALNAFRTVETLAGLSSTELREIASGYQQLGMIAEAKRLALASLAANTSDRETQKLAVRLCELTRDDAALAKVYATVAVAEGPEKTSTPSSNALRAAWKSGDFNAEDADFRYFVDVNAAVAKARSAEVRANDATILADVRVDRVRENGLTSSHVQQLFLIGSEAAARDFAVRTIQYSPASESLSIVKARVHTASRGVIDAIDAGDDHVADQSAAMYYDVRSRRLRFPALEPGDVVELEYRTSPVIRDNPYGNYFASLQVFRSALPSKLKRYVAIVPEERTLYVTTQSMPEGRQTVGDGKRAYEWELTDMAGLSNEPFGPAVTEYAPYVHLSTIRDFNQLGSWYAELIAPQMELNNELRQVANKIAYDHPDLRDRVEAVYQFVLTNTRYVALEFGIYSYKPYPVADVFSRKFGDCKDKATLMIALLRAVGVDADIALVRTRSLGPISQSAASIALFNHAIVYVPQFNLWLDGTADYYAARELPGDDQGAMALTVSPDGAAVLREIPVTNAEQNQRSRVVTAQVREDGTIQFTGSSQTRGEDAPALRRDFEVVERQRESVRRALADVFPTVHVDDVHVDQPADRSVSVRFAGVLDSFKGNQVLSIRSSWMQRDYLQKLAASSSRSQDLLLGTPWSTDEQFRFELPVGARVASMPTNSELLTPFGRAILSYEVRGSTLFMNSHVEFTARRVGVSEYKAFREFCSAVDRAFRQDVKVVLR